MLRSLAAGISALGVAPLLGACGQSTPDEASSAATTVLAEAPASTPASENTITVWYYDGSINETVEAFKRANPTIGVDLKTADCKALRCCDLRCAQYRCVQSGG
jgi:ABC-type glycerol-3-phosphate transport system substrate-binding protein